MTTNENDFGLAIIATTVEDLENFSRFARENFLPVSTRNSSMTSICNQTLIDDYLSTGVNCLHLEYAMIILLSHVQLDRSCSMTTEHQTIVNGKLYKYTLNILMKPDAQTNEQFLTSIRSILIGEQFSDGHHDHASVKSFPTSRQPEFVLIRPFVQIACWSLPRRRDLKRFREDFHVTHILTLQNPTEVATTNICQHVESKGICSIHIPIEGADLSVFTSSQTIDILRTNLPAIRELLLHANEEKPVKMLIHCAAGLHRTGTITYLLLRLCHFTIDQALLIIHRTRAVTARQVAQKRIEAAETVLLREIE